MADASPGRDRPTDAVNGEAGRPPERYWLVPSVLQDRSPFARWWAAYGGEVMRLVKVGAFDLTDQELDDLAVQSEAAEPEHAAALRRLRAWRQEHPYPPPDYDSSPRYQVLRGRFQA